MPGPPLTLTPLPSPAPCSMRAAMAMARNGYGVPSPYGNGYHEEEAHGNGHTANGAPSGDANGNGRSEDGDPYGVRTRISAALMGAPAQPGASVPPRFNRTRPGYSARRSGSSRRPVRRRQRQPVVAPEVSSAIAKRILETLGELSSPLQEAREQSTPAPSMITMVDAYGGSSSAYKANSSPVLALTQPKYGRDAASPADHASPTPSASKATANNAAASSPFSFPTSTTTPTTAVTSTTTASSSPYASSPYGSGGGMAMGMGASSGGSGGGDDDEFAFTAAEVADGDVPSPAPQGSSMPTYVFSPPGKARAPGMTPRSAKKAPAVKTFASPSTGSSPSPKKTKLAPPAASDAGGVGIDDDGPELDAHGKPVMAAEGWGNLLKKFENPDEWKCNSVSKG